MSGLSGMFKNEHAIESLKAGETLFEAASRADCMFVVRSGRLGVVIDGVTVETVAPGGFVGEMGLLDDEHRSATVVALDDTEIARIDRRRFLFLIQQTPFFAIEVMRVMAHRLRAMNQLVKSTPRASAAHS
jgi:CRP/FNR family cyclic AMP-dependent transcriptional regulator